MENFWSEKLLEDLQKKNFSKTKKDESELKNFLGRYCKTFYDRNLFLAELRYSFCRSQLLPP
jgi:hypothetical protein